MKISASCRFDREWLEMFKRVGFEAVMLSLGPYFGEKSEKFPIYVDRDNPEIPESELKEYFTEWKDIIADIGLEIDQTHGVFSGHASAGNTFNYDVHLLRMIYSVKATHYLGIKKCVLHPIMIPERYNEHYKKEVFEKNIEFFKRLRPYLEEYDVYACIENMFRGDPVYRHICPTTCSRADEMCALVDALGNDRFKLCLDIGHAALTQQDPTKMVYRWATDWFAHTVRTMTVLKTCTPVRFALRQCLQAAVLNRCEPIGIRLCVPLQTSVMRVILILRQAPQRL